MKLIFIQILFLILSPCSIFINANSIYDLRINHIANPFSIDITDNSFSFKTEEDGPFTASLLKDGVTVQTKTVNLAESHSFNFDDDLDYGTEYQYLLKVPQLKLY